MRREEEFKAYKEELESREKYTFLTQEEKDEYQVMAQKPQKFNMEVAKSHPFMWMYHVIGIKPADYQFKMLDTMFKHKNVVACTSRQIGKSTVAAGFSFWAAYNNVYPSGPKKDTKIIIVSQTEDQAKKLIREIDSMITLADERMSKFTQNAPYHEPNYFRSRLVSNPTQFEIKMPRGTIKAVPPTARIRGNSADILIIDEATNLEHSDPDYFFASDASPTTTYTAGKIFLLSTPRGKSGFFHDILNPDGDEALEGWKRIWFPWTVMKKENAVEDMWEKRQRYIEKGDEVDFKQEYEASFMSGKHTYFNPEIIDQCVDPNHEMHYSYDLPVTLGIDFGDSRSRTVICVTHHDPQRNVTTLLWHKEFDQNFNNADLPDFVDSLARKRYRIKNIVPDDCVGGKTAIELLKRRGYRILPFQFSSYKQEYYEYLKTAFANKRIVLYNDVALLQQIKALETNETPSGNVQIRKPKGGKDDMVDALMLACSPYIKINARKSWRIAVIK